MDSANFWNNLIMYNENVMKWCGSIVDTYSMYDSYDLLIEEDEDIIIYDDSDEWYNTNE